MSDHPEHEDVMEVSNMIDTLQANDGNMKFRMQISGVGTKTSAYKARSGYTRFCSVPVAMESCGPPVPDVQQTSAA